MLGIYSLPELRFALWLKKRHFPADTAWLQAPTIEPRQACQLGHKRVVSGVSSQSFRPPATHRLPRANFLQMREVLAGADDLSDYILLT